MPWRGSRSRAVPPGPCGGSRGGSRLPRAERPLARAPRWGGGGRQSPEAKPGERGIGGGGSRAGAAPRRSSITCLWRRGPSQGFPERLGEGGLCLGPPRRPGQVRAAPPSRPEPRRAARPGIGPSPHSGGTGPGRAGRDSVRFRCSRSPEQPPRWFGGDSGRWFEARYWFIGVHGPDRGAARLQRPLPAGTAARPRGGTAGPSPAGCSGRREPPRSLQRPCQTRCCRDTR